VVVGGFGECDSKDLDSRSFALGGEVFAKPASRFEIELAIAGVDLAVGE
jgi:hypothetical protein